jgi:hypothetical protein
VYRRILNERRRTTSEGYAGKFRSHSGRAQKARLEMKQGDDELWKREQEVTGRDEPEAFLEDTDAELRSKREQSTQQRALKEQQRILKQSVGYTISGRF